MTLDPIAPGPRVRPYLACEDAEAALEFYTSVFGMELRVCLRMPAERIGHAELTLGEQSLYVCDEFPDVGAQSPSSLGGSPVALSLYVEDVDATVTKAVAAGAELQGEIKDEFYGDRVARILDPSGHRWLLHTRIEGVSPEEMERRFTRMLRGE